MTRIQLISNIGIRGKFVPKGSIVEVTSSFASDMIGSGRAIAISDIFPVVNTNVPTLPKDEMETQKSQHKRKKKSYS